MSDDFKEYAEKHLIEGIEIDDFLTRPEYEESRMVMKLAFEEERMPINDQVANVVNAQLLYLESVDKKADVKMYINSPGGSVYAGLGIYDTMQAVAPSVGTYNMGLCASMAFVLLTAGEKGKRYALKHSRSMQHQPLGGAEGQASDIEITAQQILLLKKILNTSFKLIPR